MRTALNLAIGSGMRFSKDDFKHIAERFRTGYWFSDDGGEQFYVDVLDSSTLKTTIVGVAPAGGGSVVLLVSGGTAFTGANLTMTGYFKDLEASYSGYPGTGITKDIASPTDPLYARVYSGASNIFNQINSYNANSTNVEVNFVSPVTADTARVILSTVPHDVNLIQWQSIGSNPPIMLLTGASQQSLPGSGSIIFSGFDVSNFPNVPVYTRVDTWDYAQNYSAFTGNPASKDTTIYATIDPGFDSAYVLSGTHNNFDIIDQNNVTGVIVEASFTSTYTGTNYVNFRIGDGATAVTGLNIVQPSGTGSVAFTGISCTGLAPGPHGLYIVVKTGATSITFLGRPPTLDTGAPGFPTVANIPATEVNPINVINNSTYQGIYVARLTVVNSYSTGDSVSLLVQKNGIKAQSAFHIPGSNMLIFSMTGASLTGFTSTGNATLHVITKDIYGNTGESPSLKTIEYITGAPPAPTGMSIVASAVNPSNIASSGNYTGLTLAVSWSGASYTGETGTIFISDLIGQSVFTGFNSTIPGNTQHITGFTLSGISEGKLSFYISMFDRYLNNATYFMNKGIYDKTSPEAPIKVTKPYFNDDPENMVMIRFVPGASYAAPIDVHLGTGLLIAGGVYSPSIGARVFYKEDRIATGIYGPWKDDIITGEQDRIRVNSLILTTGETDNVSVQGQIRDTAQNASPWSSGVTVRKIIMTTLLTGNMAIVPLYKVHLE